MSRADVTALRSEYLRQCSRARWGEAAAAVVLLSFEPLGGDERLARHASRGGVDWDAVLADRTWSPAERFLIATAAALWSGRNTKADMSRAAFLDDTFFAVWQAMITAARTGQIPGPHGGDQR